ncbi:hypothetical protein B0T25DRAFT_447782, partial [Lasiosphaeria hispida]
STDPQDDVTVCGVYPFLNEFPPVETVVRSDPVELDRVTSNCDLVSYRRGPAQGRTGIFKPSVTYGHWTEMQAMLQLPPHPHLLAIDCTVLDEIERKRVVGFTTRVIPDGDLTSSYHRSRPFKLAWLRQLMQTADDLSLRFRVLHQDIRARNCLVDPDTDNLLLTDFGMAAMVGQAADERGHDFAGRVPSAERAQRNDVKGVIIFLHEIITRSAFYSEILDVSEADMERRDKWAKHPDVEFDRDIDVFCQEMMAWVRKRRSSGAQMQEAAYPERICWPPRPRVTLKDLRLFLGSTPASALIDHGRILLATGKYVDDLDETHGESSVNKPKVRTPAAPRSIMLWRGALKRWCWGEQSDDIATLLR